MSSAHIGAGGGFCLGPILCAPPSVLCETENGVSSLTVYFTKSAVEPLPDAVVTASIAKPLRQPVGTLAEILLALSMLNVAVWSGTKETPRSQVPFRFSILVRAVEGTVVPEVMRRHGIRHYSSIVEISPGSCPSSLAFRTRRMIFPDRVFGSDWTMSISDGTPIFPSSFIT